MSIEMMNAAWRTEGLTPTKKLILLLLGSYADENNQCYPSHKHIAKIIGLKDTKGIQKTIKEFEGLGYLKIEHRKTKDGGFTSNRYTLLLSSGKSTPTRQKPLRVGVSEPDNTKDYTKTNINQSFNEFWKIYPKKVGKKTAEKSFFKIDCKFYDRVIYGAKRFRYESRNNDLKFIPHPTTWLNQERWMDYFSVDDEGYVSRKKFKRNNINNIAG